jgi:hypothetical protein
MLLCAEVNAEDFYVIHHEMGHVEYYMAYRNQPTVFHVYFPQTAVINTMQTDVVVKRLVPFLPIQESWVQISSWRFSILTSFMSYLSVHPNKRQDSTLNYATTTSFHILYNSLFINHSTIQYYSLSY